MHTHPIPRAIIFDANPLSVAIIPVPLVIAVEILSGFLDLWRCFLADLSTCLYEVEVLGSAEMLSIGRGVW